jgi:uncharacterized membrane protein
MSRTIAATFDNDSHANNAAHEIRQKGIKTDDISIVAKHNDDKSDSGFKGNRGDRSEGHVNDNISDGTVTGGIIGGVAGVLLGAGTLMIPGLGIIAAAGPITGLLAGTATGGIVGGLVDLGIPEENSKRYQEDIKSGRVLFTAKVDEDSERVIADILKRNGATQVDRYVH